MYPAYSHTDSYPFHSYPMPYGGTYHYPVPPQCHGGWNHSHFGGPYGFQPPYPHYPPPPCYTYPPFPATYPAFEQPRYDYDKTTHGPHRCCGCAHREDDKKSRIEPEVDKKINDSLVVKDYPYPIMWVPPGYMKNTEQEAKHDHVLLKHREPSKKDGNGEAARDGLPFPIIWLPLKSNETGKENLDRVTRDGSTFFANDDKKRGPMENEVELETINKHGVEKVIPVKQMGTEEEKKSPKGLGTETKPEKPEGKTSSKTSKLPPVCLRIEPLPKNNVSRSPSPPRKSKKTPTENPKSSQQQTQLSEDLKNKERTKIDIKTINVFDDVNVIREIKVKKAVKKSKLSEHEAALIIQSAYRGFEVRKSQPLTKLKQITEVKKQAVDLRNRIQDLDSSSSSINKQKLIIGETIMSLLLKLDTIQGLHPIVRDVRKSVAKELVGLQEKLDSITSSIMNPNPENPYVEKAQSSDNHEVESTESRDNDINPEQELNNTLLQMLDIDHPVDDGTKEKCDMKVETGIERFEEDGDNNLDTGEIKQVMEENERLKEVVEEMVRAGNEQLGVITELTGKVRELERKLSRKKMKKTKTRKRRSHGCVFQDELKSCLV